MDVITNEYYKSYDYISRYSTVPIYYNKLRESDVNSISPLLNQNIRYTTYKVEPGDTFDIIAMNLYNNSSLYWVICNFNRIQDPFKIPKPGTLLKIPSISDLEFLN